MPITCLDIMRKIEDKYPLCNCENYDNAGLIIGRPEKIVNKICLCLDITEEVCSEAVKNSADMIISHHPLIFNGIKKITENDGLGKIIMHLIKNDICVYAAHTNYDSSFDGMNDVICRKLSLENVSVLENNKPIKLYKFVVYVPYGYEDKVRDAILNAGAGYIGNYSHCSFNSEGIGTFKANDGCNPFIGEIGKIEKTKEIRIETIVKKDDLDSIIRVMKSVHPYEEPAYDVFPENIDIENGIGRYGTIKNDVTLKEFCDMVKLKLNIPYLNVAGDLDKKVKKAAVVSGAGIDYVSDAINCGCDVFLTGDVKHHQAIDALRQGISVVDGSHYYTEACFMESMCDFINENFRVFVYKTEKNTNPFIRV